MPPTHGHPVLALLQPGLAAAQSSASAFLDEKFQFRIGGQAFTKFRSTLRIDSETLGRGTEFSLENDVNVEEPGPGGAGHAQKPGHRLGAGPRHCDDSLVRRSVYLFYMWTGFFHVFYVVLFLEIIPSPPSAEGRERARVRAILAKV